MTPRPWPTIDVVLEGYGVNTDAGLAALCAVVLVGGPDAAGRHTRILVDPAHVGRRTFLWDALARRGLEPTDIDLVVLTHAHWDHMQNIDVFDHAPLCIHPDERRYSHHPQRADWATPAWTGVVLEQLKLREVEPGDELIPGVGVVDLAGHTVGSIGISVHNQDGLSLITGDALHYASVAHTRLNPMIFWDPEQARASIDRALEMADVIYPGHDQPFRLTGSGDIEYLRPFRLGITGTAADRSGLHFSPAAASWVMPESAGLVERRAAFRRAAGQRQAAPRYTRG